MILTTIAWNIHDKWITCSLVQVYIIHNPTWGWGFWQWVLIFHSLWQKLNFSLGLGICNSRLSPRLSGAASDQWSSIMDHCGPLSKAGAYLRRSGNALSGLDPIESHFYDLVPFCNSIKISKYADLSCPIAGSCSISHFICILDSQEILKKFYSSSFHITHGKRPEFDTVIELLAFGGKRME